MICDFAQAYGVYDWRSLPLRTAATLAAGLGPGSRCEGASVGLRVSVRDFLTALCADRLALLLCIQTGNETPPPLFADDMIVRTETPDTGRFASGADFEAWWNGESKES